MKTKYISLFFSFVIAFGMMSCSSEIPNGDTSKFSDLKSPEEDMVKKDYLPLKHPCMLHTQADIDRVKSNLTRCLRSTGSKRLCAKFLYRKNECFA